MKIVGLTEFLTLPPGTVFMKYTPCRLSEPMVKADSITRHNDFYYSSLCDEIDVDSSEARHAILDAAENDSALSIPMHFNTTDRDGYYDSGQMFAVYEVADMTGLMNKLGFGGILEMKTKSAIAGASISTGMAVSVTGHRWIYKGRLINPLTWLSFERVQIVTPTGVDHMVVTPRPGTFIGVDFILHVKNSAGEWEPITPPPSRNKPKTPDQYDPRRQLPDAIRRRYVIVKESWLGVAALSFGRDFGHLPDAICYVDMVNGAYKDSYHIYDQDAGKLVYICDKGLTIRPVEHTAAWAQLHIRDASK